LFSFVKPAAGPELIERTDFLVHKSYFQ